MNWLASGLCSFVSIKFNFLHCIDETWALSRVERLAWIRFLSHVCRVHLQCWLLSIGVASNTMHHHSLLFFCSFIHSFIVWIGKENRLAGKRRVCDFQMLALFDTALFCVLSKRKDFEIKTISTATKIMKMVYIFRCVALIKIITFRLLSNPSSEKKQIV